jgi:NAD(P)-dependent dehydrogenase (short-subunit alcohol dehydrogenase family)
MSEFQQRHIGTKTLITGGSQGLGFAIACRLASEGAEMIVISGRDRAKGELAAASITALGARCVFLPADVSKLDDCARLIAQAIDFADGLNSLVNSAAVTTRSSLLDTTRAQWAEHINTNARGPFFLMQGFVKHLKEGGRPGSIVNILSVASHCGRSWLAPYAASKAALAALTKNVVHAHRCDRIRCNGINVGWMETPGEARIQVTYNEGGDSWLEAAERRLPMGQLAKPEQLADLVAYLLSPLSGIVTGSLIDYNQNIVGAPCDSEGAV